MNAMAPTRLSQLHQWRVPLCAGPAAAAEARKQVRAAIWAWDVSVDPDVAILLVSELVTNAIRHETDVTIMLAISCSRGELRVDVHDTSCSLPVVMDAAGDAETGRGLLLVATLSAEWGFYRTPTGKAVYFTLTSEPGRADSGRVPQGFPDVETVNRTLSSSDSPSPQSAPAFPVPAIPVPAIPAARSPRRDRAQRRAPRGVRARVDVELLQDARDISRDCTA
jgi:anti-sigma regulatory factor (Ser/Thr protein kinase)